MYLVGNFSDCESKRKVTYIEGLELKEKLGLTYFTETNRFDDAFKQKFLQTFETDEKKSEDTN